MSEKMIQMVNTNRDRVTDRDSRSKLIGTTKFSNSRSVGAAQTHREKKRKTKLIGQEHRMGACKCKNG